MKAESADGQTGSTGKSWPSVPKVAGAEFEQSVAVAQLAVKLCELQKRELQNKWKAEDRNYAHDIQTAVTENEKKRLNEQRNKQMGSRMATLDTEGFLSRAWQLIEKAREHVLRQQTDEEYLVALGGSPEAAEEVLRRKPSASRVPFKKLCDPKRNKGDSETVHGVIWKVFTTERGFDDLFWAYWTDIGEQWRQWMKGEKPRTPWMKRDAVTFWKLAYNKEKYSGGFEQLWKERGQSMLDSWKRDGVLANDFLALAKFRREHDKRAANLKPKQKQKNRRTTVKSRVRTRKHRTR